MRARLRQMAPRKLERERERKKYTYSGGVIGARRVHSILQAQVVNGTTLAASIAMEKEACHGPGHARNCMTK